MQPVDAVKLLYQNEFGGGHLIRDPEGCLNYLRMEYAAVEKDDSIPLYEHIGNGIVRVNLAAVKAEELEQLGIAFLRSADDHKGSLDRFKEKLKVLYKVTESGAFAFGTGELQAYLESYAASGYPMVSHSQAYRASYKPAYRIIALEKRNPTHADTI